jgi:hypothetical protein
MDPEHRLWTRALAAALVTVALTTGANADVTAYAKSLQLTASGGPTRAEHQHDWRKLVAVVRAFDAGSGKRLFERKSPALTTLWVTPDGEYVVGLSRIKFANPSQVVILRRDGTLVHEQAVRCDALRASGGFCSESKTNFIHWFDTAQPEIELATDGGRPMELSVKAMRNPLCDPVREWLSEAEKQKCSRPPERVRLRLSVP